MPCCTGVIAEYNPFHNGHSYQLQQARCVTGCEQVVVVMSGSFVQRGEAAMFDKFSRARWALQNGADMVLQLPTIYACSTAERFAEGAVRVLNGTGIVDALCFGSESGDIAEIKKVAALAAEETTAHKEMLLKHLKQGMSFPSARSKAFAERHGGHLAEAASMPNDILGIEYLRAIGKFAPHIVPYAIKRVGVSHDANKADGAFASASALRRLVLSGDTDALRTYLPENVFAEITRQIVDGTAPYAQDCLSDAVLYALRRMTKEDLKRLPDVNEGLENVLYRCAREASGYRELLSLMKTRRYTLARLKRILIYALLGVESDIYPSALPYIRVLGVRKDSLSLLNALGKNASLPVVTRFSDTLDLPQNALLLHEIDMRAADIVPLARKCFKNAAFDYASPLLIV
jgi:predicted nucleotidyltransferase